MDLAPIIVFAYNRPDHLKKTLSWLGHNELANQSVLYVFLDGAKIDASPEQLKRINDARSVAHQFAAVPTFEKVFFIERERNLGLGESIIAGVTEVINRHGKCIVLEDDLETSPLFLVYMNKCLDHYENRKTVFSISATSRPHPERFFPADYNYDVYVSLTHRPTGWATWKDRWEQVDWQADAYHVLKQTPAMISAFNRLGADYFDALTYQQEKGQNVWSIRFALSHFVNHAVSICPVVSYINHIGWDCEATNAIGGSQKWRFDRLASKKDIVFLDVLYEDSRIINNWYSFSIQKRRSWLGRIVNWFGRRYLDRDEYYLKGRVFYK